MVLTKDKKFYRSLLLLAIPMVLQNLITFSVGLADNLMIGSLGDSAISGVYAASQLQTALQVLSVGIEGAILLLSAQYWGRGNRKSVRRIVAIGTQFSLGLGLVFTLACALFSEPIIRLFNKDAGVIQAGADYLFILSFSFLFFCLTQALIASMRSVEVTRIGLIVSLVSLVVNVGLNYVFIFGKLGIPAMGVKGAALATLIARICETTVIVWHVRFADKRLSLRFRDFLILDRALLRDLVRYGMPIVAGQLVWGTNLLCSNIILGRLFPSSVTAAITTGASLANTVNSMMYVAMNGLSGAVGVLIGKKVGSGDVSDIRGYANAVQLLFLGLGVLTGGIFALIGAPFIGLYDISPEAASYAAQFIYVLCFTAVGTCYQCPCLFGLVKSGGDVSFVFKNDTIFVFGVVLPSAVITALCGCPPWLVFLCLKSDQILKCFVAFFKIRRYDWMKNLTRVDP